MDVQLKRGLLEVAVLAAVGRGETYGYRIIKELQPYIVIAEPTLYPILRRLEADSLLTVRADAHNGRLRKYYAITPKGEQRLQAFRAEWEQMQSISQFILQEVDHA